MNQFGEASIKLAVASQLVVDAREHAEQRLKFEFDRFGLLNQQRVSMITIGTIGQMIFREILLARKIAHDFELQAGKFDNFDFRIGGHIIEVKTSGYRGGDEWQFLNAIYNESQLLDALRKSYFAAVQIFISGYDKTTKILVCDDCIDAVIAGWIKISEISKFPARNLGLARAHVVPLNDLHPLDSLFTAVTISRSEIEIKENPF